LKHSQTFLQNVRMYIGQLKRDVVYESQQVCITGIKIENAPIIELTCKIELRNIIESTAGDVLGII